VLVAEARRPRAAPVPRAGRVRSCRAPRGRPWAPARDVRNARAYLVRIAVNHALRRRDRAGRDTYPGQWLPEPLVSDAADEVVRGEEFSMAVLVVLETLTPAERAVFVPHEVFGYAHPEIAAILAHSPTAVRQLAHRARVHADPAVLLFADDGPFAVLVLEVHGDRVGGSYSITNPDKLTRPGRHNSG
jgi:hypothetical protein